MDSPRSTRCSTTRRATAATRCASSGAYLAELEQLAASTADFDVLAHVDYSVRYWPTGATPFAFESVEPECRAVLDALAGSGRALEVNTRLPLAAVVVRWWHQAGGVAVTFGSDAHRPDDVARGFASAAAMVRACGFRPARDPGDPWRRA